MKYLTLIWLAFVSGFNLGTNLAILIYISRQKKIPK
jgi:hypothetical protein